MKKVHLHHLLLILCIVNFSEICSTANAQCNSTDYNALKNIYENNNGSNWFNSSGWSEVINESPPNCNLSLMHGISTNNGRVTEVNLSSNNLTGSFPTVLTSLTNLEIINLSRNNLSGTIPSSINNITSLEELNLGDNEFVGSIPGINFGKLGNLVILNLNKNSLVNSIPASLKNLTNLEVLDLSVNDISGLIPPQLCDLSNLKTLYLNTNELDGNIPPQLCNISGLINFSLAENNLTGCIPENIGNLTNLQILRLSSNQLDEGGIPEGICELSSLRVLGVGYNKISGPIPKEIGCTNPLLEVIDFQQNHLRGGIPESLVCLAAANRKRGKNLSFATHINGMATPYHAENLSVFCNSIPGSNVNPGNSFRQVWGNNCNNYGPPSTPSVVEVWPGDANNDGRVSIADHIALSEHLYATLNGPVRSGNCCNWSEKDANAWDIPNEYGLDLAYLDCNGDGLINSDDREVIEMNMNNKNSNSIPADLCHLESDCRDPDESPNLNIELVKINGPDDDKVRLQINLTHTDNIDIYKLHNGYFTISVDALILGATVNLGSAWFNNLDVFSNIPPENSNTIQIAFMRNDGLSSTGSGYIGFIDFILSPNSNTFNDNDYDFSTQRMRFNDEDNNIELIQNIGNYRVIASEDCTNGNKTIFSNTNGILHKFTGQITTNGNVTISPNEAIEYRANRIRLNNGFEARAGSRFRAVYGCQ